MLDILISRVKEEIAIDGSSGSSIDQVWEYVESISKVIAEESGALITPLVDEKYKAFIWNYLKLEKDLEFYENVAPQDQEVETESIVTEENAVKLIDNAAPERDEGVVELLQSIESTSSGKKRKNPPKSKTKSTPKKKPAKKAKKPTKKKKKVVAGDSDDDYEAVGDSSSSSSESEFEQDTDEMEESDDIQSEVESDGYGSEQDGSSRKKQTLTLSKAPKAATTKPKKKNVKTTLKFIEQLPELTYEEVVEKYGSRLYVTGSIKLQEQQLYVGVPPGANLSPNLVIILKEVLKTRNRGLLQADITKNLDLDSRSTGHYCKSLEERGAIIRNGVSINKIRTNSCMHARYASKKTEIEIDEDDDDTPYNVNSKGVVFSQDMLRDSMIDLMKDAPDFLIWSEDVMRALGFDNSKKAVRKWYNRTINELCEKGHIIKTNVKFEGKRPRRCIQLVRAPELAKTSEDLPVEDCEYPIRISSIRNDIPILSFPVDSSVDSQLLQVLLVAGENGCTQRELEFALNTDDNRMVYRVLEKMCEMKGIGLERFGAMRLLEFEGKLRRYRYYTYAAYKKVHENIDFIPQPLPDEDTLGFTLKEKDLFVDVPHTLKLYQRFMLQTRRELGLMKPSKKKLPDGTEVPKSTKLGRPRKHPIGQPRKSKKKANAENSTNDASASSSTALPTAEASTTNNTPSIEGPSAPIDAPVVAVSDTTTEPSATASIAETPAENMNVDIPTDPIQSETSIANEVNAEIIATPAEQSNSSSTINDNAPIQSSTTDTPPTTLVRRRQSVSSVEEIPSKKAKLIINDKINEAPAVSNEDLTKSATQAETAVSAESDTPTSVSTLVADPTNVRKKTIADYFTKLPKKPVERNQTNSTTVITNNVSQASDSTSNTDVAAAISQPMDIDQTSAAVGSTNTDEVSNAEITTSEEASNAVASVIETTTNGIPIADDSTTDTSAIADVTIAENPTTENSNIESSTTEISTVDNAAAKTKVTENPVVETADTRGSRDWAVNFKKGATHRNKQLNIYLEIRMKVLLAILEDRPMWEIGKDLKNEYMRKATEISGTPKYVVCNKTLWRSASTLAERGEASIDIVECALLNGSTIKRKILLHKNVDINGEEYAHYKKNLQDRRIYQQKYTHLGKVTTIDTQVESLEDRIDRMKQQLEELNNDGKTAEARLLEVRIDELSENAQKFKPLGLNKNMSSWMITGIQFGWIHARMLRVKLLYMYIFGLLVKEEPIEGVDKENRRITMAAVINNFPLSLYCNIIGVFDLVPAVVEYVRNPDHAEINYSDMPNYIREELYSNKNKFRRRLRALFYGLEYLGLITHLRSTLEGLVTAEKFDNLAVLFCVERIGVIRETKKLGQPIIREHTLDTMSDVTLYWSELQYFSTHIDEIIPPEELEPEPKNPIESEFWKGIRNVRGWSNETVYTRKQRKILNSYVDKVKGTTPLKNNSICADIADEINTSISYVKRYFAKVEVAIERKRLHRQEQALQRRLKKPISTRTSRRKINPDFEGRRVINLSSTRVFHSVYAYPHRNQNINFNIEDNKIAESNSEEHTNCGADDQKLFMDDIDNAPVLSNSTMSMRLKRRTRKPWPAEDDELLIYSYVILRHRSASRSTFRWPAILQVFPDRSTDQCRNRLDRMLTDIEYMEQLETATILWSRFYTEGIQQGEIENPNPREMVDFDLLSLLTYFLKRLNDGGPLFKQVILPAKVADIKRKYSVTRGVANANPYYYEDRYYSSPTLVTQMAALYHQSLSVRRVEEREYDTNYSAIEKENIVENRIVDLLKIYSMMCLLSPAETYDPFYAYYAITSYPTHLHQLAIEELRSDGTLIQAKLDRSIPNTKYGLSAKILTLMAGRLPENMFSQAKEYYKYLKEQTTNNRFVPEFVSSGMMACLLSLLSENKLSVVIANKTSKMRSLETAQFHSRQTDRSLAVLDLDLQISDKDESSVTGSWIDPPDAKKTSMLEFDIQFNRFLKTQPEDMKKLLQSITDSIKTQKGEGLTLYQLKLKIEEQADDATILNAIHLLEYSEPPMLIRVGFETSRYVLSPFIDTWTISTEAVSSLANLTRAKDERQSCSVDNSDKARKEIIYPKLWNDINGYTTDVVLKGCKNVIVDYILRRPGTSEANIYRNFSMAFSRVNLQELLESLVQDNVLRKVSLIQQNESKDRKNIFSKSLSFKCTNKPVIEKLTQTCYWVTNPFLF